MFSNYGGRVYLVEDTGICYAMRNVTTVPIILLSLNSCKRALELSKPDEYILIRLVDANESLIYLFDVYLRVTYWRFAVLKSYDFALFCDT